MNHPFSLVMQHAHMCLCSVEIVSSENKELSSKVAVLERENRSLLQQLLDMRRSLGQPTTLLVLALAFSLVPLSVPSAAMPVFAPHAADPASVPEVAQQSSFMLNPLSWIVSVASATGAENTQPNAPPTLNRSDGNGGRVFFRASRTL